MENNALGTEQVRWDLSNFYSGVGDPQIDKDLAELVTLEKKFYENYKGKLAERLGGAIADFAEISMRVEKIFVYLYLRQSLDVTEATVKAKMAEAERISSEASGNFLTFFDIELVALDDATLAKFYAVRPGGGTPPAVDRTRTRFQTASLERAGGRRARKTISVRSRFMERVF